MRVGVKTLHLISYIIKIPSMDENPEIQKETRLRFYARIAIRAILLSMAVGVVSAVIMVIVYKFLPVTNTMFMRIQSDKHNVPTTQTWIPLTEISPNLALAVVSSEDNLFTQHNGFSLDAIKRAMEHNEKSKRIHGGSTISQQVAKNVFLWNGRSWVRKGLEAGFTVLIELIWGKERIMEVYLNVVELAPGVYGAEAASQKFFKHSAKRITREEAALMAAVLPNPARMKLARPSEYVYKRQGQILYLMDKIGRVKYE